jgi:hypothetical protein
MSFRNHFISQAEIFSFYSSFELSKQIGAKFIHVGKEERIDQNMLASGSENIERVRLFTDFN